MLPFMPAARAKTVFDIPYQDIFQIGFKGIIFDIDQTLVMHGAPITKEIYDLLQKLKQIGFRLFFLSNNSKERIVEFNQDLSIPFIPLSEKPNPKNFIKALEMMDLEPFETVMIGDQLFTDVLGASRANIPTILLHLLIVHSPMEITEFHAHSDALDPDKGERKPFANGTSVQYNNQDYRFKNNTDQVMQLRTWVDNEILFGELRSESQFPFTFQIIEEDHHFKKEGDHYYRNSMIYREKLDRKTEEILGKELILKNHSMVMYDPNLIPKEMIRQ